MRQLKSTDVLSATAVIAALTFVSPAAARSATRVVSPGQSIQAAVDRAAPGDTIGTPNGEPR